MEKTWVDRVPVLCWCACGVACRSAPQWSCAWWVYRCICPTTNYPAPDYRSHRSPCTHPWQQTLQPSAVTRNWRPLRLPVQPRREKAGAISMSWDCYEALETPSLGMMGRWINRGRVMAGAYSPTLPSDHTDLGAPWNENNVKRCVRKEIHIRIIFAVLWSQQFKS